MRLLTKSPARRSGLLLSALLGLAVLSGCVEAPGGTVSTGRPAMPDRVFSSDTVWTTHLTIGGELNDSILLIPTQPKVNEAGIYLTDLAADRVMHFNHQGELVWAVGRTGAGPGEFQAARGLGVAADGSVWVADQPLGRVTVVSAEGEIEHLITPAVGGRIHFIVPLADSSAILTLPGLPAPLARIDLEGRLLETIAFPWEGFAEMHSLSNQFLVAADVASDDWVAAFRVGDGFFPFTAASAADHRGWYVEELPFPMPVVEHDGNMTTTSFPVQPPSTAVAATLSPTSLYVLFGGETEYSMRVIDRYSRADGSYVESILLPTWAVDITWFDGGLYVLRQRPYPEITYMTRASPLP